jgi:hypothetical protein
MPISRSRVNPHRSGGDPLGGRFVIGRSAFKTVAKPARASLSATNRFGAKDACRSFEALQRLSAGSHRIAPVGESLPRSADRRARTVRAGVAEDPGQVVPADPHALACERRRRSKRWNSPRRAIAVDTADPPSAAGMERYWAGRTDRAPAVFAPAAVDRAGSGRCGVALGGEAGRDHQRRARQSRSGAARVPRAIVTGAAGSTSAARNVTPPMVQPSFAAAC